MSLNPELAPLLSEQEHGVLLDIADAAISHGLRTGERSDVDASVYPVRLQEPRATFVTLRVEGKLKGCMGSLSRLQPLVVDIAWNAHSAAFSDPRFPALSPFEYERLAIQISILSSPAPIEFASEGELLARIRPGLHGLTLSEGEKRGTLLPSVWASVPDARQFLKQLKRKAGLPMDYWSPTIQVECYTTECFSRAKGVD